MCQVIRVILKIAKIKLETIRVRLGTADALIYLTQLLN